MNVNAIMASLVWGSIGFGFFIYGKRQSALYILLAGIALMLVSYLLIGSALYMSLASVGIVVASIWLNNQFG